MLFYAYYSARKGKSKTRATILLDASKQPDFCVLEKLVCGIIQNGAFVIY
jgi:hypothetical protein